MKTCDCYRVKSEQHCFVDENGVPVYEYVNTPRCWGTKEKDVCDCGGDKSKCNFYKRVRTKAAEENSLLITKGVLEDLEDLIMCHWGCDPIYYTDSEDKAEASAAKLCCKILEVIHMSRIIETDEEQ